MSSWWDTTGFTNLATQAFKNAQKKIDRVLDIEDGTEGKPSKRKSSKPTQESAGKDLKANPESEGDFWSVWMGPKSTDTDKESDATASSSSSWSLPWSLSSESDRKQHSAASVSKQHLSESESKQHSYKSEKKTHSSESNGKQHLSRPESKQPGKKEESFQEVELVAPSKETSSVQSLKHSLEKEVLPSKLNEDVPHPVLQDGSERFSENVSQVQEITVYSDTSQDLPDVENFSGVKDSFFVEKSKQFNISHEPGVGDNIHAKGVIDSSFMEISNISGDSGGWDISDSVLKLVEMDEQSKTETNSSKDSVDDKDSILQADSLSNDNIKGRESLEAGISSETSPVSCRKDRDADTESRESHDIKVEMNDKSDSKFQIVSLESEQITGDSLVEQRYVSKQSDSQDDLLLQKMEVCEPESFVENVSINENSRVIHEEDTLQERTVVYSSEVLDLSSSEKLDLEKNNEKITSVEEDSNMQTELTHGYINVNSGDSDMNLSDFSQPNVDAEVSISGSDLDTNVGNTSSTGSSEISRLDSSADTIVEKSSMETESEEKKDIPYSLFSGEKVIEEDGQAELIKSVSPASSYVKCMIEEAMEESGKEDSGSDNHSSEGKSESSKVDSELEKSVYSGHESSDDIETTTSSDIEIISAPLISNSDKQFYPSYDMPGLKINLQPRLSGPEGKGHYRSDSQSSSSTQSKGGDQERLSPERGDGNAWADEELQHPDLEAVQEEGTDNPYHPESLLKKLAEMAEVLQARETKLVQMSKDNHQLMEDNSILRNQLQQSEEARDAETADLKALTDEFTIRIGESERKLQAALREKDSLKTQLTTSQAELEKRSQGSDLEALLEEKTEQVNELLVEGEKLSKQQLQSSTIIKKLRAKEKETDATLTTQKKKIEEKTKELERLKVVLDSKEQMESKQSEAITQLNSAVQRQEREYSKILSDLEDAQEKNRGLQTALDNAYKEIAELHRSNASQDCKAQETALSVETSVREELRISMEREQMRFKQEREAFIMQADDLRLDMARLEKEHERREDLLKEEIAHLQERLQQDEARSQDLSQSVTSATRPLLRQIENLQATFGAQSRAWEKVEKNLTDRLAEGQTALALAQEKERTASDNYMEISAKLASFEMTNTRLKQEKASLIAEKEAEQSRLEELQDAKNSLFAQFEASRQNLNHEIGQLKMEKVELESQLNLNRSKLETEKKKCSALEEQLVLAERERPRSRGTPSPSPSMSVSRQESLAGSFHEYSALGMKLPPYDDDAGSSIMGVSKSSVYENLRQSGTIVVENLQSQLKLREGEIVQLQNDIAQLERTRESMARELVNLTNQNEELQETKVAFQQLEEQFQELNNRYSAILLMYGEKEEQVQELRLDLQDVKEMYKTQIDALLAK